MKTFSETYNDKTSARERKPSKNDIVSLTRNEVIEILIYRRLPDQLFVE